MSEAGLLQSLIIEVRALRAEVAELRPESLPGRPADPVAVVLEQLQERCHARGRRVSVDGYVSAETAGFLLDRSADTLKRWRRTDPGRLEFRRIGNRAEYSLREIAEFLALNTPDDF